VTSFDALIEYARPRVERARHLLNQVDARSPDPEQRLDLIEALRELTHAWEQVIHLAEMHQR
jgi:uncharacterized tellurite resistance protein B-like protein